MNLSVTEAARILGKSTRMVRYLIQEGLIPAKRDGHRWVIDSAELTAATKGLRDDQTRRSEDLKNRVTQALSEVEPRAAGRIDGGSSGKRLHSVRDLRCFAVGGEVIGAVEEVVRKQGSKGAPQLLNARQHLTRYVAALADGWHQFEIEPKLEGLRRARSEATAALGELLHLGLVDPRVDLKPVTDRIEGALLGNLGGLIRHIQKRRG